MESLQAGVLSEALDNLLSEPVEAAQHRARTTFDDEVRGWNGRFVLFGAGNMGRRVLARLRQDGIEPLAFSDNHNARWATTIDGLAVLRPADAIARYGSNAVFIVTIYNNQHSFPDTERDLVRLGCKKVVSVIYFRWKYSESFLPYFRDDLPSRVLQQRDAIRDAFGLWADDRSRAEFFGQILWRLQGEFGGLTNPSAQDEYFPRELFQLREDECVVDVGAYDGDTIRKFLGMQGDRFRRIVALEPDPQNFERLSDCIASMPKERAEKIEIHARAASSDTRRLKFVGGEGVASSLSEQGSIEVESIRLDDLLGTVHPTYIKMDVEGAEIKAIEGCRQTLIVDRPILAACVYHAQDHLWKIPLQLSKICSRTQYFLRPHMAECWDTVCYAIPEERCQSVAVQRSSGAKSAGPDVRQREANRYDE